MTDFAQWAQEYLDEAAAIQARINDLREESKTATISQLADLRYRMAMLYTMYLECRHTGRLLQEHPAALRENARREVI